MKNVLITGASGFVGTELAEALITKGYRVTGVGTSPKHPELDEGDQFIWISADTTQPGTWMEHVRDAEIIINLAGRNIFRPWTKAYKQQIYDSRILTTRNIYGAIQETETPKVLLSTSAIGLYGDKGDVQLNEETGHGDGFLSKVCVDWEREALKAEASNIRVCIMRFGVVLGKKGALEKMIPAFKLFLGGPLGSGNQYFPWIQIQDIINGILFLIDKDNLDGAFNFSAPQPVRQKEFARVLGKTLNRPSFMPAPAFLVKTLMGELGEAFLESQKAIPDRLLKSGFSFLFTDLSKALESLVGK